MATIVGLYYKTAGIETGGTNSETGLLSGTLIEPAPWVTGHSYSVGDTVSNSGTAYGCATAHTSGTFATDLGSGNWTSLGACAQASISALGTVYTLYFRAIDPATGDDAGQDSVTNIIFTPPTNTQVCATWNGTFSSDALQLSVKAIGGNQPIYVKQTSGVATSPGKLNIGALDWAAGTRVAQVGTVTPTPGDSEVSLAWSDIASETGYQVRRATNEAMTTGLVTLATALAAGSTSYVNNATNGNAPVVGTTYWYQVRGFSALGMGPWSVTVSGETLPPAGALFEELWADLTAWEGVPSDLFGLLSVANGLLTWTSLEYGNLWRIRTIADYSDVRPLRATFEDVGVGTAWDHASFVGFECNGRFWGVLFSNGMKAVVGTQFNQLGYADPGIGSHNSVADFVVTIKSDGGITVTRNGTQIYDGGSSENWTGVWNPCVMGGASSDMGGDWIIGKITVEEG